MAQTNAGGTTTVWGLPIMDGFSFSQAVNSSEVTLNEMENASGVSKRGRKVFNDSLSAAEFSFQMYARPLATVLGATNGWEPSDGVVTARAVEEALWANFIAVNEYTSGGTGTAGSWEFGVTASTDVSTVYDFNDSNKSTLGTFDIYFTLNGCDTDATNNQVYKINDCVINTMNMDFDIDGISTLSISGFGSQISDVGAADPSDPEDTILIADGSYLTGGEFIAEGVTATDNFVRNRLTQMEITAGDTTSFPGSGAGAYSIAITGGSINFENNITFLTPEELCHVNVPIGHICGTRTIGGSFTAYLSSGTAGDAADFFEDLIDNTDIITNSFDITFKVGGSVTPRLEFNFPQCHVEIPTHSIEDVVSLECNFSALSSDLDTADEATITYYTP